MTSKNNNSTSLSSATMTQRSSPPSSSMFLAVHPLPSNDDELNDKILETVEKFRSQTNPNNPPSSGAGGSNSHSNVPVINFAGSNISSAISQNESSTNGGDSLSMKMAQQQQSAGQTVLQCVVSRNHVAVLLDDHRVCRYPFNIYAERINGSNVQSESSSSNTKKSIYASTLNSVSGGNNNGTGTSGGGSSSPRSVPSRRRLVRRGGNRSSASVIMSRSHMIPAQYVPEELVNQAQVVLQGKSRNVIIRELQRTNLDVNSAVNNLLSRDDEDFDDADDSPEQLIHSEDLISLLDSGFASQDHSVIIDPEFSEEAVFSYPVRIRGSPSIFPPNNQNQSTSSGQSGSGNNNSGSTGGGSSSNTNVGGSNGNSGSSSNRIRLREEPYSFVERELGLSPHSQTLNGKRWYSVTQESVKNLESGGGGSGLRHQSSTSSSSNKKKCDQIQLSPISFTDQEYWLGSNDRKFIQIASLHSELVAINNQGQLCQWRWQDSEPFKCQISDGIYYFHPRVPSLGLLSEKIQHLSASVIRATVVTETNKLATWMDESIAAAAWKLEHSATNQLFTDTLSAALSGSFKITSLYVSSLMSCVQLSSGSLFWWGTPPFSHRKKMAEKGQNERSKSKSKSSSSTSQSVSNMNSKDNEIVQGTLVSMRNSPIYQCGAIGFTTVGGVPKKFNPDYPANSGSTSSSTPTAIPVVTNNQTVANKNLERAEMPPPPSPASSTSSESSNTNAPVVKRARGRNLSSSSGQQLQQQSSSNNEERNLDRIETWNLKDVVFVEDVKNMPIGRVIKVDGNFVAVKFNATLSDNPVSMNKNQQLQEQQQQQSRPSGETDSIESYIQDCRLLRKEDLIAVRAFSSTSSAPLTFFNNSMIVGNKAYDYVQRTPKRVPLAEHMQILTMTLTNLGLHAIAKMGGYRLSYLQINIVSGRIEHDNKLSIEYSTFFGSGTNPKSSLIRLFSAGENEQTTVVLCRDGNGTLYPLAKDCTNMVIREPISLNLGPISTIGLGIFSLQNINGGGGLPYSTTSSSSQPMKTHAAILALTLERQYLMPAILNCDLDGVRQCLALLNTYPKVFFPMISEVCDGNHNIIHVAVSACFPTSNKPRPSTDSVQIHIQLLGDDDDLVQQDPRPTSSSSLLNDTTMNDSSDATTSNNQQQPVQNQPSATFGNSSEPLLDPTEQKPIAHSILWTLLDSPTLSGHLFDLLSARDYQGLTPFMLAISGRAYSAAQQIFVIMQRVARMIANNEMASGSTQQQHDRSSPSSSITQDSIYQRTFIQMLYPRGSSPDHSPLYMLCSNDTCTFTWTGDEHINQDIFECRTCGLVGSLCCCTECARVCHRGHDCKLKRTSPTAYCDCWEKCKCKALIAGCQPARNNLLKKLLESTNLSQRVNARGEHILLFLVQTVGRQIIEQKQYRPTRLRAFAVSSGNNNSGGRSKNELNDEQSSVPEHDLEPPKFARRALEKMLSDWPTVKSMILTGYRSTENVAQQQRRQSYLWNLNGTANAYSYEEENSYLSCQNGSALLDKFTHSLLKLNLSDPIDRITGTILQSCKTPSIAQEGRIVARRFVRSVIRVSLAVLFEANPVQYSMAYAPLMETSSYRTYCERYLSAQSTSTSSSSSSSPSSLQKKSNSMITMMRKIRKVFVSLLPIAAEELCEVAESLIAPVKMGLARPSSSFMMMAPSSSSSSNTSDLGGSITDELFSVDTSVYSHQRDFLDATFGLHDPTMLEPEPIGSVSQNHNSHHMLWNSYDQSSADLSAAGAASASQSSESQANNNNNQNQQQQQQPSQHESQTTSNDDDLTSAPIPSFQSLIFSEQSTESSTASVSASTNQPPEIVIERSANEDNNSQIGSDQHQSNLTSAASDADIDMLVAGNQMMSEADDNSNVGGRLDTESDSESNPDDGASYLSNADNASAQRSVVTGATAGSDVGVASLPYDDESLNSNADDVDDDDDDEQDVEPDDDESSDSDDASDTAETEPDTDVLSSFINDNVERRLGVIGGSSSNATAGSSSQTATTGSARHNILQHVQWALRSHRDQMLSSTAPTNLTESFRRSAISNALVSMENVVQITNSMVGLARAFSIIIRHIADLMVIIRETTNEMGSIDFPIYHINSTESKQLLQMIEDRLLNTWNWLINSMDATETQLRFGCALSNRRLTPSVSGGIGSSTSGSSNALSSSGSGKADVGVSNSNSASAYVASSNPRSLRLRTFQSQDEMAMLPTFNRNSLRSRTGGGTAYVFTRTSAGTNAAAQVASGSAVAAGSGGSSGNGGSNASSNESNQAAHRDFLNYAMSLMRAHSNEHYDSLPVLDVSSLKHVAYIFDAFVYFIRRGFITIDSHPEIMTTEIIDSSSSIKNKDELISSGRNHLFFRRSNSTLFLGCPRPDPFSAPYHEALPLASKPQLLQPNARREQLFGIPRPSNAMEAEEMLESLPSQMSLSKRHQWNYNSSIRSPNHLQISPARSHSVITESSTSSSSRVSIIQPNKLSVIVMAGSAKHQQQQTTSPTSQNLTNNNQSSVIKISANHQQQKHVNFFGNIQQQDVLLGRWRLTLELFGRLFVDDVSLEPNSIIPELTGFPIKESKFRREMERLRISCSNAAANQRDLNFYKLDRDRNQLLIQSFKELNSVFSPITRRLSSQTSVAPQSLTITRVKVTFKEEPGEGSGVARSFYTAFSEAVLANEKLPAELLTNNCCGANSMVNIRGGGSSANSSSGTVAGNYEAYSSYAFRLRSHSSNNNNSNGSSSGQRNSGATGSGSGSANSALSNSSSPVNDILASNSSNSSSMRRPRSPARYRPFYPSSSTARRTQLIERIRNMHEPRSSTSTTSSGGSTTSAPSSSSTSNFRRITSSQLRYDAPSFVPTQMINSHRHSPIVPSDSRNGIGLRIYNRVYNLHPGHASKITGMLLEIPQETLISLLNNEDELRNSIDWAMEIIHTNEARNQSSSGNQSTAQTTANNTAQDGSLQRDASSSNANIQQQQSLFLPSFLTVDALMYENYNADRKIQLSVLNSGGYKTMSNDSSSTNATILQLENPFSDDDDAPLFYQPGTRGIYSPRAGRASENRLNAFRNVGRIIGVCFLQNELCPITFNRHVIKMILDQPVRWHDLAFFDSELYESLRQLILDAQSNNKEEILAECDFRFAIDLPPEEGGHGVELIQNGRNIRVTPQNVYDYVRRYAQYKMVESQEKAIKAIRAGICDVIPLFSFDGLTPEDFRLLLNGVNEINVQQLQTYVTFYDESGDSEPITNIRKWFWWVLERMTNEEKQDLIYFWTGSPALPASEEGFQPMPSVTIRPRDDYYFVTANTCISRLYIPLYSSRNVLRQKLLMSIKSKSFGFI
ncbi:E3 ubiquitin-protein ligase ubr5 [Dermatophagoides farinae]|uniref:E3 ubiquitin-protein ligase ubr5 n=1 Tax=Dermatophagoides farinae TaxID=6954 RepID=A0A922HTI3_DERFA|nr:E3 ubiquitin-protein ligase ubr5 [Dermatophagoides farinae]